VFFRSEQQWFEQTADPIALEKKNKTGSAAHQPDPIGNSLKKQKKKKTKAKRSARAHVPEYPVPICQSQKKKTNRF
jgi:hypothetical protein